MVQQAGRFSQKNRISASGDYNQVFRSPCRSSDNRFTVIARENGLDYARLGLAISKKNVKLSVARNRVKRLIRESFRKNQLQLKGLDIVVTTSRKPELNSNAAIFKSLQLHWQRLIKCKPS